MNLKYKLLSFNSSALNFSALVLSTTSYSTAFFSVASLPSYAGDFGVGISISELNTPVEPPKPELDLSTQSGTLQLSFNEEDWLLSVSISKANNEKNDVQNNRVESAKFEQTSKEIYASYFYENWTISGAIGTSTLDHDVTNVVSVSNNRIALVQREVTQQEMYGNDFVEVSLGYWFDLDSMVSNLSLSMDTGFTKYDSSISQISDTYLTQLIDSELLTTYLEENGLSLGLQQQNNISLNPQDEIISLSGTLNYAFNYFNLEWYVSAWVTEEWSDAQSGIISLSRNRNGRVVSRTLSSIAEWTDESTTTRYTSYGASAELSVTENLSVSMSLFQDDDTSAQWQLGAFYYF